MIKTLGKSYIVILADMEATKIKHVTIKKLWGLKTISTDFNEGVNIFIGANGSSKTTFLNLIEATLFVDINILSTIEFEEIDIVFIPIAPSENTMIQVIKQDIDGTTYICYRLDDMSEVEIPCNDMILSRPYRTLRMRETISLLKERIKSIVNISWLSVNRDNINPIEFDRRENVERLKNMVDIKLKDLVRGLIMYQLQLESEANKISNKFKEDVLSLMLYNEAVDVFKLDTLNRYIQVDTQQMQRDLYRAFNALGVVRDKKEAIQKHIQTIKSVVERISKPENTQLTLEDAFVLSLINRTLSIIEISRVHEAQTKEIYAPIDNFWKYLKEFIPSKTFKINKEGQGDIDITVDENGKGSPIGITSLSSGEKQLFILLTEALLQRNIPYLFIADEPELSLHIGWQRKILKELQRLNCNAQIIVATHSPEVAGSFPENVINMQNIISYE